MTAWIVAAELMGVGLCMLALLVEPTRAPFARSQRPVLLGLLAATAAVHASEVLEWTSWRDVAEVGETFAVLLPVLWVFLVTGISRTQLLRAVHSRNRQLEVVLDNAPSAIALFDAERRYLACSGPWRQAYHPGRKVPFAELDLAEEASPLARAIEGVLTELEVRGVADSEGPVAVTVEHSETEWLAWSGQAWRRPSGKVGGFVVIADVVTDEVRAEDAARRAAERAAHDNRVEIVGMLSSSVAHDVRNFLTVVSAHLDIVSDPEASADELRESAQDTQTAVTASSKLLGELTDLSRAHVDALARLDLNDLVAGDSRIFSRPLTSKVRLAVAPHEGPVIVLANRVKLQQVVLNLVINARDAMPGGGEVRVEVGVEQTPEGEAAVLRVRDQGCGMSEAVRARVFEPHFTTKEVGKGTGLGLAIVARVLRELGGQVRIESEEGVGTTVILQMPLVAGGAGSSDEYPAPRQAC